MGGVLTGHGISRIEQGAYCLVGGEEVACFAHCEACVCGHRSRRLSVLQQIFNRQDQAWERLIADDRHLFNLCSGITPSGLRINPLPQGWGHGGDPGPPPPTKERLLNTYGRGGWLVSWIAARRISRIWPISRAKLGCRSII